MCVWLDVCISMCTDTWGLSMFTHTDGVKYNDPITPNRKTNLVLHTEALRSRPISWMRRMAPSRIPGPPMSSSRFT